MDRRAFFRLAPTTAEVPSPDRPLLAPLAISAGLEPHTDPLDQLSAAHLLRRAHFGVAPEELAAYTGQSASGVAAALVQEAADAPMPEEPEWINDFPPGRGAPQAERQEYRMKNRERLRDYVAEWFMRMTEHGLREKMTLFWHNHFVTEIAVYQWAPLAYRYVTTLRAHALGNFKDFVHAIGIDPAMLFYLNGIQNRVGEPNENYSRELLELFTMGQFDGQGNENYTQPDIEEIARALTGWGFTDRGGYEAVLIPNRHDDGEKTFFGRAGNWGYDDVIDILFEERAPQIAEFIARKLYREFIYAAEDEALVADLAQVFLDNDFEIAPVVSALLSSAHFFDEQVAGAHIKSPVELIVGLLLELEILAGPEVFSILNRVIEPLQQAVLNPPNVAGWEGHHTWLNTTTFVARWNLVDLLLGRLSNTDRMNLVALAEKLHDSSDPNAAFTLPVALAEHLMAVPLDLLDLHVSDAPFAGDLMEFPIPDEVLNGPAYAMNLAKMFLADVPWYEWDLQSNGASGRIAAYIQALKFLPEFQLA